VRLLRRPPPTANWRASSRALRMDWLQCLHDVVAAAEEELTAQMIEEYGGPVRFSNPTAKRARRFPFGASARTLLADYQFERQVCTARVCHGIAGRRGLITPWNANYGFICSKLAMAIAAGSTAVIKPSELDVARPDRPADTRLASRRSAARAFQYRDRPRRHGGSRDRAAIPALPRSRSRVRLRSAKSISSGAVDTMKRVTLELGGKSPTVLLDDADFAKAMPFAAMAATNEPAARPALPAPACWYRARGCRKRMNGSLLHSRQCGSAIRATLQPVIGPMVHAQSSMSVCRTTSRKGSTKGRRC